MTPPIQLEPGDTLIYGRSEWYDLAICLKTWSPACHVEIYSGDGFSMASRNGLGVNRYRLRLPQLIAIRRPKQPFAFDVAEGWFKSVARGQKYDWLGLLCFTLAVKQGSPNKMFCSEFWKQFYAAGGLDVMAPDWPADKTAPAQCLQTSSLVTLWTATQSMREITHAWHPFRQIPLPA